MNLTHKELLDSLHVKYYYNRKTKQHQKVLLLNHLTQDLRPIQYVFIKNITRNLENLLLKYNILKPYKNSLINNIFQHILTKPLYFIPDINSIHQYQYIHQLAYQYKIYSNKPFNLREHLKTYQQLIPTSYYPPPPPYPYLHFNFNPQDNQEEINRKETILFNNFISQFQNIEQYLSRTERKLFEFVDKLKQENQSLHFPKFDCITKDPQSTQSPQIAKYIILPINLPKLLDLDLKKIPQYRNTFSKHQLQFETPQKGLTHDPQSAMSRFFKECGATPEFIKLVTDAIVDVIADLYNGNKTSNVTIVQINPQGQPTPVSTPTNDNLVLVVHHTKQISKVYQDLETDRLELKPHHPTFQILKKKDFFYMYSPFINHTEDIHQNPQSIDNLIEYNN